MRNYRVLYYNQNENNVPIVNTIESIFDKVDDYTNIVGKDPEDIYRWLKEYDFAIFHGMPKINKDNRSYNGKLPYIDWYEQLSDTNKDSTKGLIVLFITSGINNRKQIKVNFKGGVRYLLPIKNANNSGLIGVEQEDNWKRFLQILSDSNILNAYFQGITDKDGVDELKIYLEDKKPAVFLTSLTILFQMFLAAHTPPAKNDCKVSEVLSEIGWWAFCRQQANSDLLRKVQSKRVLTESSDWYEPLRKHYKIEKFIKKIDAEIDMIPDNIKSSINTEAFKVRMKNLITNIFKNTNLDTDSHIESIADIYTDLKKFV